MKQRLSALITALCLCLALAGCSFSTPDTVGELGGVEITSGLYLLAQFEAYQSAAQAAGEDQDYTDVKAFLKETIMTEDGEEKTVSDYIAEETEETLRRYAATELLFEARGGELTPAETDAAESYAKQLVDNYGELYGANGIGLETIQLYEYNLYKQANLIDLIYGEDGSEPLSDAELTEHLDSSMVYASYLTVPLYNTSTFALADEDQTAEMLALADTAIDAYKAGGEQSVAAFQEAVADVLPDVYAVLETEYDAADTAGDFVTGFLTSSDLDSYFTAEAADAILALEPGEGAALQYTSYALMFIIRQDPLETYTLNALRGDILSDMSSELLDRALDETASSLTSTLDESAMKKLPASKISLA